jgi:hypothetical protein
MVSAKHSPFIQLSSITLICEDVLNPSARNYEHIEFRRAANEWLAR